MMAAASKGRLAVGEVGWDRRRGREAAEGDVAASGVSGAEAAAAAAVQEGGRQQCAEECGGEEGEEEDGGGIKKIMNNIDNIS